jgi:(2Fe-2S) ferredoxin
MPRRCHLFVCTNARPEGGRPACGTRGGDDVLAAVTEAVLRRGAGGRIAVTPSGCLGPCFDGPNAVEYPIGRWWSQLTADDADALAAILDGEEPSDAMRDKLLDRD